MNFFFRLKKIEVLAILIFICLMVSSNFFLLNIGGIGRTLPFNAMLISLSLIMISISIWRISKSDKIRIPKFIIHVAVILLVMISPLLFMKSDVYHFLPRLLVIFGALLVFVSFYQFNSYRLPQLLWSIALVGVSQIVWGGYEFFIDEQNRPYGIFQQVNVFASFMATVFAISGFLAIRAKSFITSVFLSLLSVSSIFLVYLTDSRTGIISLSIVFLFLSPATYRFFNKREVKLWLVTSSISLAIIFWSLFSGVSLITSTPEVEVSETASSSFLSKSGREFIYPQVLKLSFENLWTGVGFENFRTAYLNNTAEWYYNNEEEYYGLYNLDHPHSEILYWFAEGGIISLTGTLLLMSFILYRIFRTPLGWRLAFLALVTPISLHTLLEYPLYHSQIHLMILLVLLFVIDCYSRGRVISFSMRLRIIPVITMQLFIVSLSLFYLSSISYANYLMKEFELAEDQNKNLEKLEFLDDNWLLGPAYERYYRSKYVIDAINRRSESRVENYIVWAESRMREVPPLSEYRYLIFAYTALGNKDSAEKVKERADYLFPKFEIKKRIFNVPLVIKGT